MRLRRATVSNFKLLRDVSIEFSTDPERPLTVIRAANASGKTSTLNALRWGLFGLPALHDRGVRLSPLDWSEGTPCEVQVTIDFTNTTYDVVGGEVHPNEQPFMLVRRITEIPEPGGVFHREPERVDLYEVTEQGTTPVEGAAVVLNEMLPMEMRDIFLTDGDAALTFISPDLGPAAKQQKVKDAIRSLLGLTILEDAEKHLAKSATKFKKQLGKAAGTDEATYVTEQIETKSELLDRVEAGIAEVDRQIVQLTRLEKETDDRLIQAAQAVGDLKALGDRKKAARDQRDAARALHEQYKRDHQQLLQAEDLSLALIGDVLEKGLTILDGLHDRGIIPSTSVPVLRDRIELGTCICGTDLSADTDARSHVEELIQVQQAQDVHKEKLTELHHIAHAALAGYASDAEHGTAWLDRMSALERVRAGALKVIEGQDRVIVECDDKLNLVDVNDIATLQQQKDAHRSALEEKKESRAAMQVSAQQLATDLEDLDIRFKEIKRATAKQREADSRLVVTQDLQRVITATLKDLREDYIERVSQRMNELFLAMVGVDPEAAGHVFQRAEIEDFEIRVFTSGDIAMNADHELNGASKRALTFAFIWALTDVSGVAAPRIVDTPLGMMSGRMKKRAVEEICRPSIGEDGLASEKQVVLMLTRAEIANVEDVLDAYSGTWTTFTNTDHFPVDVVNDPHTAQPDIRVCECNHRQMCDQCRRHDDGEYGLLYREVRK